MCVFCAAVPATLVVGANLSAKQLRERRKVEEQGKAPPEKKKILSDKIAFIATGILAVASTIYHSQFNG
jgi:hypothetical protein